MSEPASAARAQGEARAALFEAPDDIEAINRLYRAVDDGVQGLVMNPAGFNHAGYALRDCIFALPFPYVEVHMTNIEKRGIKSVLAPAAVGSVFGFGVQSYVLGLEAMLKLLRK